MSAAIRPYSIAVAPASHLANFARVFITDYSQLDCAYLTLRPLKRRTLNATRGWIDLIVAFKVQRRFRNNASKATLDLKFAPSLASR
jgi:hypothetical protein